MVATELTTMVKGDLPTDIHYQRVDNIDRHVTPDLSIFVVAETSGRPCEQHPSSPCCKLHLSLGTEFLQPPSAAEALCSPILLCGHHLTVCQTLAITARDNKAFSVLFVNTQHSSPVNKVFICRC